MRQDALQHAGVAADLQAAGGRIGGGELAGLRRTALHRLMEQYQQFDPFKFLIYAELAGAEIGPVE